MDTTKEDIKPILILLKQFLPQFTFQKNDLLKLNASFVIQFYGHWFNQLTNYCQQTLGEVLDNCSQEVDKEHFLFLFIQDLFHKIGLPYFSLCDFYRPSNRTRTTMKISLNFLFYIKEVLPKSQNLVQSFKQKAEALRLTQERICLKKKEVSDATYRIGLLKEKFEELEKEYNDELTIQTSLENNDEVSDIEQLQNEFDTLSMSVLLQEQQLRSQNKEIKVLEDQIITDDPEIYKKDLKQLEMKIQDHELLISKNQRIMQEKHKELECLNDLTYHLQKTGTSALDCVEEIENLKRKLRDIELSERDMLERNKIIESRNQKIIETDIEFQKDIIQMEDTLSNKKKELEVLNVKSREEELIQKQFNIDYQDFQKKLDANQTEIVEVQIDQKNLENEVKKYYARILKGQTAVTVKFVHILNDMLQSDEN